MTVLVPDRYKRHVMQVSISGDWLPHEAAEVAPVRGLQMGEGAQACYSARPRCGAVARSSHQRSARQPKALPCDHPQHFEELCNCVLPSSSLGRPLASWLSLHRLFEASLSSHPALRLWCLRQRLAPTLGRHVTGEADRLQRLEIELLGASSTGYDPRAAAAAAAAARAQDRESSSGAHPSAPFALPPRADFQWAWRCGSPSLEIHDVWSPSEVWMMSDSITHGAAPEWSYHRSLRSQICCAGASVHSPAAAGRGTRWLTQAWVLRRDAPTPPEPRFFTAPIQSITFGQVRQGADFIFGSRGHDPPPEAGAGGVAMES